MTSLPRTHGSESSWGNARSLEIEGNRITQIPAFNTFYPRADAIRVVDGIARENAQPIYELA